MTNGWTSASHSPLILRARHMPCRHVTSIRQGSSGCDRKLRFQPRHGRQVLAADGLSTAYPHIHLTGHYAMLTGLINGAELPGTQRERDRLLLTFVQMHPLKSLQGPQRCAWNS